MADIKIRCMAT